MASIQSFDITTGCEMHEVDNAVGQTKKEVGQRYDFKGVRVEVEAMHADNKIHLVAPDEFKLRALRDVLHQKLVRRKVPVKNLQPGNVLPAAGSHVQQDILLQQGIPTDTGREIVKQIKNLRLKKVQAQIQGDQVRVSSPSREDLQQVISLLRDQDLGMELQFGNYRGT